MSDVRKMLKAELAAAKESVLGFPWADVESYANWVAQSYHIARHSTRLVALAGGLMPLGREDLHARFVDHAREERGHEKICILDLQTLGRKIDEFPCLPGTAAMYQTQYYWSQHRSPVSFLGYVLSLEGLACEFGSELFRRAEAAHGPKATRFLRVHADADVEHTEKALSFIDGLSAAEKSEVGENLRFSTAHYCAMLVQAQGAQGVKKRAA